MTTQSTATTARKPDTPKNAKPLSTANARRVAQTPATPGDPGNPGWDIRKQPKALLGDRTPPTVIATIARRVLLTYALDPDAAAALLPPPFRPDLSLGPALGGVCLLRLRAVRPALLPLRAGLTMESVAHRMSVEWDTPDGIATGVYVFRRDADSALAARLGGLHRAVFGVVEGGGRYSLAAQSRDGAMSVAFTGEQADAMPAGSVFTGPDSASAFFRCSSTAYSPAPDGAGHTALRMVTPPWRGIPVRADHVQSSFFEDRSRFPRGTAVFDSAIAMHDVPARWKPVRALEPGCDPGSGPGLSPAR
ncbi:MAG: hypothetical protein HOW97_31550 [Catenulispora sp.]|nr:hypothetical protein [Catenulispora sp.]